MNYPGDFPATAEERAELLLAANAAWLARAKERGHAPGGAYGQHPEWEALDETRMERDNHAALEFARKAIATERKAHKCFICGRRDLPRYARWFTVSAATFFGLLFLSNGSASIFGYLGAAASGAAFASSMHEGIKPNDEPTLRKETRFH